jgi:hypothetical protein
MMAAGQEAQAGLPSVDQFALDQVVVRQGPVPPVAPPLVVVAWRVFLVLVAFMAVAYLSIAAFAVSTYPSLKDFPSGTVVDLRNARAEWLAATKELGQTFVLTPLLSLLGAILGYLLGRERRTSPEE